MQETQVRSLGREDPLEKGMAPTLVFLPGESHGQRISEFQKNIYFCFTDYAKAFDCVDQNKLEYS